MRVRQVQELQLAARRDGVLRDRVLLGSKGLVVAVGCVDETVVDVDLGCFGVGRGRLIGREGRDGLEEGSLETAAVGGVGDGVARDRVAQLIDDVEIFGAVDLGEGAMARTVPCSGFNGRTLCEGSGG